MRLSKPAAAKSSWSTFWRATLRRRWSIGRAEARHERGRCDFTDIADDAALAVARDMGNDSGCLRGVDRAGAALVDVTGGDLRAVLARVRCPGDGLRRLFAIAEAPDLLPAVCAGRAGAGRDPVVGCAVGRAALRGQPHHQAAGAAGAVLSFRTLLPRDVG